MLWRSALWTLTTAMETAPWPAGTPEQRAQSRASGEECWKEPTCGGDGSTERDIPRSAEKTCNCRNMREGSYRYGVATWPASRKTTGLRKHCEYDQCSGGDGAKAITRTSGQGVYPKRFKIFRWEAQLCKSHGDGSAERSAVSNKLM